MCIVNGIGNFFFSVGIPQAHTVDCLLWSRLSRAEARAQSESSCLAGRTPGSTLFLAPHNWAWWCTPVIRALWRCGGSGDQKSKVDLGYPVSSRPAWTAWNSVSKIISLKIYQIWLWSRQNQNGQWMDEGTCCRTLSPKEQLFVSPPLSGWDGSMDTKPPLVLSSP